MNKLALFSETLNDLPIAEAMQATAEAGYPAVELACRAPHLGPELARTAAADVAAQIRDSGLTLAALSMHNTFTDPATLDDELQRARIYIEAAPKMGTSIVQMDPGPPAGADAGDEHWRCLESALQQLAPMARDAGVRLAFHTTMRQMTITLAPTLRFLEMAPADCIGTTIDFCNMGIWGDDPVEIASAVGERILHVHIKNGHLEDNGDWFFGPLDAGVVDYTTLLPALRATGFAGYLSIESIDRNAKKFPPEQAKEAARRDLELLRGYLQATEWTA